MVFWYFFWKGFPHIGQHLFTASPKLPEVLPRLCQGHAVVLVAWLCCRLYKHIIFPKTDGTDIRYRFFLRHRQCQISTAGAGIAFFLLYIRFLLDFLLGVHFWVKPLFISVHKCQKRISHHFLPVLPLFLSVSIPVFHPDLGNKYPQEIYHRFW